MRTISIYIVMLSVICMWGDLRAQTRPTTVPVTGAAASDSRIPAARLDGNGGVRFEQMHESFLKRGKEGPIDILFIGDSITEFWNRFPEVWTKYYGDRNAANFGISGDKTQGVLWRIDHGELEGIKPKVVVLMIGTNNSNVNSPEQIAEAIGMIVGRIREKTGSKILLLAIFPRDNPTDQNQTPTINAINPIIAKLDDGKNIRFLDISQKFKSDNGKLNQSLFRDGVHPNAAGYDVWGNAVAPLLDEMSKP